MNIYRPRLYHIKNEKQLWKYFEKNAGYLEDNDSYTIAGLFSNDTHTLYKKLEKTWQEDVETRAKELLNEL